jgi:hypothetical protein
MVLRRSRRHMGDNAKGMQEAFGVVIFVVVGIGAVIAVVTLFTRGRLYDDIGRGGMSIGDEREPGRPRPSTTSGPVNRRERDAEIRQMLEARNARRAARGEATVDVEAELQALTRPAVAADAELREEVRALVEARNARRVAHGQAPLDVESETERRLRELPG